MQQHFCGLLQAGLLHLFIVIESSGASNVPLLGDAAFDKRIALLCKPPHDQKHAFSPEIKLFGHQVNSWWELLGKFGVFYPDSS
ncbi:MAG: hypothetical protein ABW104_16000 [Candidatus Thiodiazotropha sp. 6PLUC2]